MSRALLVVRLSAIGDVVHTLPAAAALQRAGRRVHWLVEPAARVLLAGSPAVERVFAAPAARRFSLRAATATLRELRAERHELALDLQGLWKSAVWARLAGADRTLGYARRSRREPLSALLMNAGVSPPAECVHVIDQHLSVLRPLGIEAIGLREFPLPLSPEVQAATGERLARAGLTTERLALLNPGGGWASKLWPAERFGHLARELRSIGLTPLVTWGPGEEAVADAVVVASEGAAVRAFATTLLEYVELARRAALVVAADTGPMHLACAVGAPVVALFGPTDPARNGPFSARDQVVRRVPACAPCHRRVCARHAGVMTGIEVEDVLAAVRRRLEAAGRP